MNRPNDESDNKNSQTLPEELLNATPDAIIRILLNSMQSPANAISLYVDALSNKSEIKPHIVAQLGEEGTVEYLAERIKACTDEIHDALRMAATYITMRGAKDNTK